MSKTGSIDAISGAVAVSESDSVEPVRKQRSHTPARDVDAKSPAGVPARLTRAAVHKPLAGAFGAEVAGGRPSTSQPASGPGWSGPILDASMLDERNERRLLKENGGRARLLPYGDFDASRTPVVLVHGIDGSGVDLRDIASALQAKGRQVFFLLFDDRGTLTHESGTQMAVELRALRQNYYSAGTAIDIVGHSMGGIVSRAALNSLQQPNWIADAPDVESSPRAGFGEVRLRTIDTPWIGYDHEAELLTPLFAPMIKFFMWLFGWLGAFEMRANSKMFESLFLPKLEGVDIRNVAAFQDPADHVRALRDLDEKQRAAVARFLLDGREPKDPSIRNMALSLAQDARFSDLQSQLRTILGRTEGSEQHRLATAVVTAYEQVMPMQRGSHIGLLVDQPARSDDTVDELVAELTS